MRRSCTTRPARPVRPHGRSRYLVTPTGSSTRGSGDSSAWRPPTPCCSRASPVRASPTSPPSLREHCSSAGPRDRTAARRPGDRHRGAPVAAVDALAGTQHGWAHSGRTGTPRVRLRAHPARAGHRTRERPAGAGAARLQQPVQPSGDQRPLRRGARPRRARAGACAPGRRADDGLAAFRGAGGVPVEDRPLGRGCGSTRRHARGGAYPRRRSRSHHRARRAARGRRVGDASVSRRRLTRTTSATCRTAWATTAWTRPWRTSEQNYAGALDAARKVIAELDRQGVELVSAAVKFAYVDALVAARALGDDDALRGLLGEIESLPPGLQPPLLRAHALRYRGLLGRGRPSSGSKPPQRSSTSTRSCRTRRSCGSTTPSGSLANGRSDEAQPLLDEARAVFERLGAVPWLERARRRLDACRPRRTAYGETVTFADPATPLEKAPPRNAHGPRAVSRAASRRPASVSVSDASAPAAQPWASDSRCDRGQLERGGRRLRADVLGHDREARRDAPGGRPARSWRSLRPSASASPAVKVKRPSRVP